jgi:poly-gamma-glutamate synthesis protein (capsule biosynthesis protein)
MMRDNQANPMKRPFRMGPWLPLLLLLCGLLSGCNLLGQPPAASPAVPAPSAPAADEGDDSSGQQAAPPKETTTEAVLVAVGDIMVHMPQLPAYYDAETDKYQFYPWFRHVAPIFHGGDWVVGNLEAPLAGADLKYTGFPRFNAPPELADALREAGFDLVSTANNHSMDRGFAGIQRTLRNVREAGLIPYGTYESAEAARELVIVEKNGIRMGFLAYTYGTNGIPIPEDKPFAVNLIQMDKIGEDIRRLKENGADLVTVSLHFGNEYQRMPSEEQVRIARSVVGLGADIILGSHPHVVQPYDIIEVPASESLSGESRKGVVIYSLGNFISNQTGDWKDVGLIFSVRIRKTTWPDGTSETGFDQVDLQPTWVHIERKGGKRYYSILPLSSSGTDFGQDPALSADTQKKMKTMYEEIMAHLKTFQSTGN